MLVVRTRDRCPTSIVSEAPRAIGRGAALMISRTIDSHVLRATRDMFGQIECALSPTCHHELLRPELDVTFEQGGFRCVVAGTHTRTYLYDGSCCFRLYIQHPNVAVRFERPTFDGLILSDHDPSARNVDYECFREKAIRFVGLQGNISFSGPYPFAHSLCATLSSDEGFRLKFDSFTYIMKDGGRVTVGTWEEFCRIATGTAT